MLTDSYGRVATDLRVSLTDRCNLRCSYCMPPEGLDWLPAPEVLTGDEMVRLIRIGVETLGIREGPVTGGEPPLDAQHGWKRTEMVTAAEVFALLAASFDLSPDTERARGAAPAETFLVNGGPARVGVIASVTRPFCGACDRVRLTADGQIRNCLFAREESDLRGAMRAGASDADLAERWRGAMMRKLPGHGIDDPAFLQPDRPMSAIGG